MIESNDVLEMYDIVLVAGQALRKDLVRYVFSTQEQGVAVENEFRVDYTKQIHDEIYKDILKNYEEFKKNPEHIIEHLFKCVSYLRLYEQIKNYQQLMIVVETINNGNCNIDEQLISQLASLDEINKLLDLNYTIANFELDELEEEIASKLTKILEK